ncbi:MAG: hypothetical protein AAB497_00215 [Patescibacteria group bacterium]
MEEIKKSYNPFKMWGSWAGLCVGIVGTFAYEGGAIYLMNFFKIDDFTAVAIFLNILQAFGGALQLTNPVILILQWPILPAVLVTPIVIFLYGWGIHSIFRKLDREWRIRLLIAIAVLIIVRGAYAYISGRQAMLEANPIMALTASQAIDKMMTTARDESAVIDERLTALESLSGKVAEMTPSERSTLSEQLVALSDKINTSSLILDLNKESDQMNKMNYQRMMARITMLQKMLVAR